MHKKYENKTSEERKRRATSQETRDVAMKGLESNDRSVKRTKIEGQCKDANCTGERRCKDNCSSYVNKNEFYNFNNKMKGQNCFENSYNQCNNKNVNSYEKDRYEMESYRRYDLVYKNSIYDREEKSSYKMSNQRDREYDRNIIRDEMTSYDRDLYRNRESNHKNIIRDEMTSYDKDLYRNRESNYGNYYENGKTEKYYRDTHLYSKLEDDYYYENKRRCIDGNDRTHEYNYRGYENYKFDHRDNRYDNQYLNKNDRHRIYDDYFNDTQYEYNRNYRDCTDFKYNNRPNDRMNFYRKADEKFSYNNDIDHYSKKSEYNRFVNEDEDLRRKYLQNKDKKLQNEAYDKNNETHKKSFYIKPEITNSILKEPLERQVNEKEINHIEKIVKTINIETIEYPAKRQFNDKEFFITEKKLKNYHNNTIEKSLKKNSHTIDSHNTDRKSENSSIETQKIIECGNNNINKNLNDFSPDDNVDDENNHFSYNKIQTTDRFTSLQNIRIIDDYNPKNFIPKNQFWDTFISTYNRIVTSYDEKIFLYGTFEECGIEVVRNKITDKHNLRIMEEKKKRFKETLSRLEKAENDFKIKKELERKEKFEKELESKDCVKNELQAICIKKIRKEKISKKELKASESYKLKNTKGLKSNSEENIKTFVKESQYLTEDKHVSKNNTKIKSNVDFTGDDLLYSNDFEFDSDRFSQATDDSSNFSEIIKRNRKSRKNRKERKNKCGSKNEKHINYKKKMPLYENNEDDRMFKHLETVYKKTVFKQKKKSKDVQDDIAYFKNGLQKIPLKVEESIIHRKGLFTEAKIYENEFIGEYVGEIITKGQSDRRERAYHKAGKKDTYMFGIDDKFVVDATRFGSRLRFINHSCNPNCYAEIKVFRDKIKRVFIGAERIIEPGEELTIDYQFKKSDDEERIVCLCKDPVCRGFIDI